MRVAAILQFVYLEPRRSQIPKKNPEESNRGSNSKYMEHRKKNTTKSADLKALNPRTGKPLTYIVTTSGLGDVTKGMSTQRHPDLQPAPSPVWVFLGLGFRV